MLALAGPACSLSAALGVDDGTTDDMEPPPQGSGGSTEGQTDGPEPEDTTTGGATTGSGLPPTECDGRELRVATFNVKDVESEGSAGHQALADILRRMDADVVCLQEVRYWETSELFALADAAGYPRVIQAEESPAIGGDVTNACLGRDVLTLEGSYTGGELGDDPGANDVGRDILVVRADLSTEDASCGLGVVTLHLKSGQEPLDWFRRQVEAERVAQAVEAYRQAHPGEPMVILGDLNETIDDPALGHLFSQVPGGLPSSYQLGSDIELPLTYQPFETFESLGFAVAYATQEDTTDADETWADIVRLDYVLYAGAELRGDEVYNSARDNGVDDAPQGNWLPKAGDPLGDGVSELASDHFPVMADLVLP